MKDLKKEIRRRIELKNLDLYNYSSFGEYVTCENDVIDLIAELLQEERQRTLEEVKRTDNYNMRLGLLQILNDFHKMYSYSNIANPDVTYLISHLSNLLSQGNEKIHRRK